MGTAEVSVIIPCYNCATTISRAVESVFNQTLRPAEVILVDDASLDNTSQVILALQQQFGSSWLRISSLPINVGPGSARNAGWALSSQAYLAFLDADDAWHPEKIAIQLAWMKLHPDVVISGHKYRIVRRQNEPHKHFRSQDVSFMPVSPKHMLLFNRLPARSVMLRRNIPYRFVESKRYSEDYLLWCEICLDGHKCVLSPAEMSYTFRREHERAGLSGDIWKMQLGELGVFWHLHKAKRISTAMLPLIMTWSTLKFVRRVFMMVAFGLARRKWST